MATKKRTKKSEVIHSSWKESYRNIFTNDEHRVNETFIERLGDELIKWATESEDALVMTQFLRLKGIPSSTAAKWLNKYEHFRLRWQEARIAIGDRREMGMIKKKYDVNAIRPVMHHYSKVWKKSEEFKANLRYKIEEAKNPGQITVILEKFDEKK